MHAHRTTATPQHGRYASLLLNVFLIYGVGRRYVIEPAQHALCTWANDEKKGSDGPLDPDPFTLAPARAPTTLRGRVGALARALAHNRTTAPAAAVATLGWFLHAWYFFHLMWRCTFAKNALVFIPYFMVGVGTAAWVESAHFARWHGRYCRAAPVGGCDMVLRKFLRARGMNLSHCVLTPLTPSPPFHILPHSSAPHIRTAPRPQDALFFSPSFVASARAAVAYVDALNRPPGARGTHRGGGGARGAADTRGAFALLPGGDDVDADADADADAAVPAPAAWREPSLDALEKGSEAGPHAPPDDTSDSKDVEGGSEEEGAAPSAAARLLWRVAPDLLAAAALLMLSPWTPPRTQVCAQQTQQTHALLPHVHRPKQLPDVLVLCLLLASLPRHPRALPRHSLPCLALPCPCPAGSSGVAVVRGRAHCRPRAPGHPPPADAAPRALLRHLRNSRPHRGRGHGHGGPHECGSLGPRLSPHALPGAGVVPPLPPAGVPSSTLSLCPCLGLYVRPHLGPI